MKILHIDSSILEGNSVTRELSSAIVTQLKAAHPEASVTYRDLIKNEIRHLTGSIAAGFRITGFENFDEATLQEHQISAELVSEFLAHDVIVIGVPMYNFSVPTQLKAWLDRLAQVGRTFKYTETGPVGLVSGTQVFVASARGGFYAEGPLAHMDYQESYLKTFFGFLGINDVHFVRAEGVSKGPQVKEAGIRHAHTTIAETLAIFQTN
ncbi:FMN-dependent NADH-azoreductase [Undibacterium sp. CY21W]|uniref:FMN-dependent NADH-azoreductase n=1 Tax=Undibacterium sp. CY21W TaxID=2762293 RepID=UPI00164BEBB9|nr:FMN-dependent NADH-azoreductase [Undibacterium sp. CY21W]MBC3926898.1 FMN-dependent NADH-azoreductase [Undibacterium sp. CY21W]